MFVLLNLSAMEQTVQLQGNDFTGSYREVFNGQQKEWSSGAKVKLAPWEYFIYETE